MRRLLITTLCLSLVSLASLGAAETSTSPEAKLAALETRVAELEARKP